jgi:phage anti-repressor protein
MINVKNNRVDARELQQLIGNKRKFANWIADCIKNVGMIEGVEYVTSMLIGKKGGKPSINYSLTIDAAKEICILSNTEGGRNLRRYLIGLSNKVENGDMFDREQVLYLTKLKTIFKYIENCDEAQKLNMANFASGSNSKYVYADFHKMRNNILKLDKETIDKRIKDFCIENNKNYIGKTKKDALLFLDKYEIVRNGVWDFLNAAGHKQSMKLAELVRDMMRIESGEMYSKNEDNLFQKKELEADIKRLQ